MNRGHLSAPGASLLDARNLSRLMAAEAVYAIKESAALLASGQRGLWRDFLSPQQRLALAYFEEMQRD